MWAQSPVLVRPGTSRLADGEPDSRQQAWQPKPLLMVKSHGECLSWKNRKSESRYTERLMLYYIQQSGNMLYFRSPVKTEVSHTLSSWGALVKFWNEAWYSKKSHALRNFVGIVCTPIQEYPSHAPLGNKTKGFLDGLTHELLQSHYVCSDIAFGLSAYLLGLG